MARLILACILLGVSFFDAGVRNAGCSPLPQAGSPSCAGKSPREYKINAEMRAFILDYFNIYRSYVASEVYRQYTNLPPAKRMPTLQWDDKLAEQAGRTARACQPQEADSCENSGEFVSVGQNVVIKQGSLEQNSSLEKLALLDSLISVWVYEIITLYSSPAYVDSFPAGPAIGNIARILNDRAWKVGCGMQKWLENDGTASYYLVCNFSSSVAVNQPIYVTGTPASGCTTGQNPTYAGLCSVNEAI